MTESSAFRHCPAAHATGAADGRVRRAGLASVRLAGLLFGAIEGGVARTSAGLRGGVFSRSRLNVIAVLLIPVIAFVPMAFSASTFLSFPPPRLSLRWFEQSPHRRSGSRNDPLFGIGFATAAITLVVGSLAALGVARTRGRLGGAAFLLFLAR